MKINEKLLPNTPEFDLDDILDINSTSDDNYVKITDAIEGSKLFYVTYYDDYLGKQYHFVPIKFDFDGNSHYFYFMNTKEINNSDDVYTEVKIQNTSGTSVTVTTREFTKQDKLVSGTNIKTINGNSILGSGNISLEEKSYIHCYETENTTSTSTTTPTKIPLTKISSKGSKLRLSNNKIYADKDCHVILFAQIYITGGLTNGQNSPIVIRTFKNGIADGCAVVYVYGNWKSARYSGYVIDLSAGDYVELGFYSDIKTGVIAGKGLGNETFLTLVEL